MAAEEDEKETGSTDKVERSASSTMVKDFKSFSRLILIKTRKKVHLYIRCYDKIRYGKI